MTQSDPSESAPPAAAPSAPTPQLFGRGMLYVVVWSLQLVIGTLVSPVLAYLLGPGNFGTLASGLAVYQVITVIAVLGLDQALVLQRADDGVSRSARGLVGVGIVVAVIVAGTAGISSRLWGGALGFGASDDPLLTAIAVWAAPAATVQLCLALLLAEDRLRPFVVVSVVAGGGGQVIGVALLLGVSATPATYLWGCVASQAAAAAIAIVVARPRLVGLTELRTVRRALRLGVPLATAGLAYFVLNAGDRLVIQRMAGADAVGRYQVAYVVGSVMILLLTFVSTSWTPRFAEIRDDEARWALAARSRDDLYRVLLPAIAGLTLAAPTLLRIVAPATFRPDSLRVVVFVVALAALPHAASVVTGRLLVIQRRGGVIGVITGIVAAVNIALNIVLIPWLGIVGAAAATLVAYWLLALLQLRRLPAQPRWRRPPAQLVAAATVVVAAAAGTLLLPQSAGWLVCLTCAAVGCLPWFWWELRRARRSPGGTDATSSMRTLRSAGAR